MLLTSYTCHLSFKITALVFINKKKEDEVFGQLTLVITVIVKGKQRKRKLRKIDYNYNRMFTRDRNIQDLSRRVTV